jgi:hypothetical protein
VLLLAITSLKDNQPYVSAFPNHALEKVVVEMDRLVDELVKLAELQTSKLMSFAVASLYPKVHTRVYFCRHHHR